MDEQKQINTDQFERCMSLIADSMEAVPAEVIYLEDEREAATKVECAEGVRHLLLNQVAFYKRELISEALVEYEMARTKFESHQAALPTDPQARRALLQSILSRSTEYQPLLTLQHRDFRTLSDEDVESLLKQLDILGAIK